MKPRGAIGFGVVATVLGCSLFDWAKPSVNDAGANDVANDALGDAGAWTCESVTSDPDIKQALPPIVATDLPNNTNVVGVAATDDLQQKIDGAHPGDVLELEAGATFTGPFTLRPFSGSGWIVIRTATADADFAMPGTRVSPALAPKMARLTSSTSAAVVSLLNGTGGYRIIGLEIEGSTSPTVDLGAGGAHDVILDRVYAHGTGLVLHGQGTALIDSYVSGATANYAINVSGGPIRISNDAIDSPSSHVLLDHASDVAICQNVMTSSSGTNTNNFQLNDASTVLVAGNVLGTLGTTLLLQQGTQSDVTVAYNRTAHANEYMLLTDSMTNVVVRDNLFDSTSPVGNEIRLFGSSNSVNGVKIDHNTFTTGLGSMLALASSGGTIATKLVFTNNFAPYGQYGVLASGGEAGSATGTAALDSYVGSYTFSYNAIWGLPSAQASYPPTNFFPANEQAVGFAADWSLDSSSAYKAKASDGRDIGADIPTLAAATTNVP